MRWGRVSQVARMVKKERKWRRTKEPLDESERGEWKSWVKAQHLENEDHGLWSYHFMANRWGNNENSERLFFLGSKITADGDCSHEIKRCLLHGRNAMTNLDSILKSRGVTLPTSGSFPMSQVFASGGQSIGASASTSVLPRNIQDWFPLGWTGWISLQSNRLSRVFSSTTVQKHQFFGAQASLWSNSHMHTWLLEKP